MKLYQLLASFILLPILGSCEKEIPLKDEEKAPRIVVNGIFEAGGEIYIHLSESRNVLYQYPLPNIFDADAKLWSADDQLLGTFTSLGEGFYTVNYTPTVGQTYKLTVSAGNFESVSASTYTPSIISVASVDTLRKGDQMTYNIHFSDNGAEENYYAVTLQKLSFYYDEFSGDTIYYTETYFCTDEIYTQNGYSDVDGTKCDEIFYFSDNSFNGQNVSFYAQHSLAKYDTSLVVVSLRSVSEDYFKYKLSLSKYYETQGDPFAQPVQVYSNIDKGFGIFGGYSVYTDTLLIW